MREKHTNKLLVALLGVFVSVFLLIGCEKDDANLGSIANDDPDSTDNDDDSDPTNNDNDKDTGVTMPDSLPPVPQCVKECSEAADCVEEGADKLHRAANYTCSGGLCEYIGCANDANCKEVYPASNYVCSSEGECLYPCDSAADCALPGMQEDEDNWACQGGGCLYLGCLNSYECVSERGADFVCADVMHLGQWECVNSCESPADCVLTTDTDAKAFDADNYDCIEVAKEIRKFCDYKGCADDAECGNGYQCVDPE
ncbi:MAG: hypothetical protein JXX29_06085 [Deltaproteobacteria bacterium]|nr:hypothetical protein [Deltaproteobacteria bacterium]MBN2671219.1 hypothetical protein [Deltaproteobacteria bacterium]